MAKLSDFAQLLPEERIRLQEMSQHEAEARLNGYQFIAGIDEAGRGPLAGPVVAAACILPPDAFLSGINDSKKLTHRQRNAFFQFLTNSSQIAFGIGIVDHEEIDRINILEATKCAMMLAVDNLPKPPDFLLIDAVQLKMLAVPFKAIIHGDALSQSIAAASVIAKVTRDMLMTSYHDTWPEYGFDKHKGYATAGHRKALETFGPCPIHRKSFEPIKSQFANRN